MKEPIENDSGLQLSLVIATRDRAELLKRCLVSLACQQIQPGAFEVIVVDNDDTPDPAVQELCRSEAADVLSPIYTHHPPRGSSGARNKGASLARGRLVGFLDDDAILSPTWAARAFAVSAETGARIFGGPYFPVYISEKPTWFKDQYASGQYGTEPGWLGERQYLFAANLVIERVLFLELGGFSTDLGPGTRFFYGEETDLQHRASKKGVRVWYDPGLSIQHHTSPAKMTPDWFISSSWQKGVVKARIFQGDFSSSKATKTRLQASWLRRAFQDALQAVLLILLLPFRNRARYPYYQNFVVEAICPRVSSLAMLLSLVRDA